MRPPTDERAFRRIALLIALVAGLHGLVYVPFVHTHVVTDSATYRAAASAILDGRYSTPLIDGFYYVDPIGLFDLTGVQVDRRAWQAQERQAFRPPGYPLYLALVGGAGDGLSLYAALVGQALLVGVTALLLILTVRRWWDSGVALLSGAVYAVDPWSKHYVSLLMSEVLAGALAVATVYAATLAWQARSVRWWAAAGALAGALTLVRAVFVVAVLLVVGAALLDRRDRVRSAAVALACAAALLVPWLAWTASVTGRPVLSSWGEGYNLLLAAHGEGLHRTQTDVANDPDFIRDNNTPHRRLPSTNRLLRDPEAHPRYMAEADVTLRRLAREEYGRRLVREAQQVAWETVYRAYFLWNAHEDWYQPGGAGRALLRVLDWLLLALAFAGAVLALRRGGPGRAIVLALLAYTAIIATHHVEARFGIPLRGFYLALVTLALAHLARRRRPQQEGA